MIQPLRTDHRRTFFLLALAVPLVFVAGLTARHGRSSETHTTRAVLVAGNDWQKHVFVIQLLHGRDGNVAKIFLTKPLAAPDVLVYLGEHPPQQRSLPQGARLLGKYDPDSSYKVPASGVLILYSTPYKSVLDSAAFGGQS